MGTSMKSKIRTVLIIGSGALKIGEAGEFDYSTSQCLKALREEKIRSVLVNPNIATYQTSEGMADKIYFLPITPHFVEEVIKKERPDGILLSFGGQTALNCGVELYETGVLKKYGVEVLGTPVETIKDTEDRDLFVKKLLEVDLKTPKSKAVVSVKEAAIAAEEIGYPVMVRVAYALGGKGSGVARNRIQLDDLTKKAFTHVKQVLIEEYLGGWKEVEYEVVRDCHDNCITVCNMENFDPLGIHTGESIVVAPSQTLTNSEYHKLRAISIKAIRHLGIIGECNIQYALDTESEDYRIIEVNARLSRSSALASKATGYPLAFIAAKLALGYALFEIPNSITKKTMACFEPALDYIVVKIPRWDLGKFKNVKKQIGSEMKSVGEVMSIARNFEEGIQKAVRMLDIDMKGLVCNKISFDDTKSELKEPTDKRMFAVVDALEKGCSIDKIYDLSKIDKWFLYKIQNIVEMKKQLIDRKNSELDYATLLKAKQYGFSDSQIALLLDRQKEEIRNIRKKMNILPCIKQIDTLAAEYPAKTNYLYMTYNGKEDDVSSSNGKKVIVIGSGPYRIGSSVEFDWCCVSCVMTLRKLGYSTIMINYNPETVSTDYDICDKLYFDELSFERVLDIYEKEKPLGIIVSMGGQIPNSLTPRLNQFGVKILGTSPKSIDNAEDRHKFSALLDRINVDQPAWRELTSIILAEDFAGEVGYPVIVRPSYVLSGAAMSVAFDKKSLHKFLDKAAVLSREYPVVISKFITNAKEIEIDAVAKKGKLLTWAISEHIENAGVHSGDATIVLPPQKLYLETVRRIKRITRKIAESLNISGPFNIQFVAKENEIKVIECNLRASRSFPFVSKVSKNNFIDIATKVIMDEPVKPVEKSALELDYVGVKAPQFSFSRLRGADPLLSVEMASTGEVACLGDDLNEAFLKSIISAGMRLPKKYVLISIGGEKNRYRFLDSVRKLHNLGFKIYATKHTSEFFSKNKIKTNKVLKVHEKDKKGINVVDLIMQGKIELVINIPDDYDAEVIEDDYVIRRLAVDFSIPLLTNLQIAKLFIEAISSISLSDLKSEPWDYYE